MLFCCLLFFLEINFFQNFFQLSGIPSECQTDWIQIRPDLLSGLFWVQTVCKVYQQTMSVNIFKRGSRFKKKVLSIICENLLVCMGAQWLSDGVLDSNSGAAGSSLTGITALWSLSKTHLS